MNEICDHNFVKFEFHDKNTSHQQKMQYNVKFIKRNVIREYVLTLANNKKII